MDLILLYVNQYNLTKMLEIIDEKISNVNLWVLYFG